MQWLKKFVRKEITKVAYMEGNGLYFQHTVFEVVIFFAVVCLSMCLSPR